MKRLIFDTETTGIIIETLPLGHERQPRIVQFAGVIVNDQWEEMSCVSVLVKPDGFQIPEGATRIHGITTELANSLGLPLLTVLSVFNHMVYAVDEVWAFNAAYDCSVFRGEFKRAARPYAMDGRNSKCAMLRCMNILKLPGGRRGDFKWPKLSEAYAYFFNGAVIEKAHDALADVRATVKVIEAIDEFESHPEDGEKPLKWLERAEFLGEE